ncbi:MAG TPA: DUF503 domain-containing protein [Acidimicrobiales bacterium]|nr:DUF503 domain-containing protein [Acidimicrobiales bacterium]
MGTHVAMLEVDIHVPAARSLKSKRAVVKPIIEGLRRRFAVAVAEVDHQDLWQRAAVAVATVSSSPAHAAEVLDACERFVWSHPEIEVVGCARRWLDDA